MTYFGPVGNRFLLDAQELLGRYLGTGRIYAVAQEEHEAQATYEFEDYYGCVKFQFAGRHGQSTGYKGRVSPLAETPFPVRGLIFEAGPKEFYLVGNFHLKLARKSSLARNMSMQLYPMIDFSAVGKGYFDENGTFVVTGERNGDEVMFGDFWAALHSRVTRVRLILCLQASAHVRTVQNIKPGKEYDYESEKYHVQRSERQPRPRPRRTDPFA